MPVNLTQLLFDIQTTRGEFNKRLNDLEARVKEAIEEEHEEHMRQRSEELTKTFAHAPGTEGAVE